MSPLYYILDISIVISKKKSPISVKLLCTSSILFYKSNYWEEQIPETNDEVNEEVYITDFVDQWMLYICGTCMQLNPPSFTTEIFLSHHSLLQLLPVE